VKITVNQKLIDDGYVNKNKHPEKDLYIYNYTPKCAYESKWNEFPELKLYRGLILDANGEVVAYPFPKFFNLEQHDANSPLGAIPPYNSFEVYDKLDGSLAILFYDGDKYSIATRGSFTSDQAIWATNFLHKNYSDKLSDPLLKNKTYLFEVVYAQNRIVVEYKGVEGLILLAINDLDGNEMSRDYIEKVADALEFPLVTKFDGIKDFTKLRDLIKRDNAEGFVVKFDNGLRVKLKYEEYVKLHSLMTNVSTTSIWEALQLNIDFNEMFRDIPDECFELIKKEKDNIQNKYNEIEKHCHKIWNDFPKEIDKNNRKSVALYITKTNGIKEYSSIMFNILDNKSYSKVIWQMIKPEFRKITMYNGQAENE